MVHLSLFISLILQGMIIGIPEAKPFTLIEDEAAGRFLPMTSVQQVVPSKDVIYLRSLRDPVVGMIGTDGRFLGTIGTAGSGPGEIDGGIMAMAVDSDDVYLVTTGHHDRVLHFENRTYRRTIPVTSVGTTMVTMSCANGFAVSGDRFVFPAPTADSQVAYLYEDEDRKTALGDPLFSKATEPDLVGRVPYINDTLWTREGNRWFGLYKYYPALIVWDGEKTKTIALEVPGALDEFANLVSPSTDPSRRGPKPDPKRLFADFSIRDGIVTVLTNGNLYQIDIESGDPTGHARVTVELPGVDGRPYTFHSFAILDDGRVLFGNINPELETLLYVVDDPF